MKRPDFVAYVLALAATLATGSAYATGTYSNHKTDGTNAWIGAVSGGSMKELSNWKILLGGQELIFSNPCYLVIRPSSGGS